MAAADPPDVGAEVAVIEVCPVIDTKDPSRVCTLAFGHDWPHVLEETTHEAVAQRLSEKRNRHRPCKGCGAFRSLAERHAPDCSFIAAKLADPERVGLWEQRTSQMSDEWHTPRPLFDALNRAFGPFTLDGASNARNRLCPEFLTKAHDAPSLHVGSHRVWLNPPYSRGNLERFMAWALRETVRSAPLFCCLVPHYTAEGWWQDTVQAPTLDLGVRMGIEEQEREDMLFVVRHWARVSIWTHALAGRVKFVEASGATGPARFSSAIVVYERPDR